MRIALVGSVLVFFAAAAVAQTSGSCSISAGKSDETMSFEWSQGDCTAGRHCHDGSRNNMPWSEWTKWSGIVPGDLEREGAAIDARRNAEAGEMRCVGTVHLGALRGSYTFTPNAEFARSMEAMGFGGQTPERLQGYAFLDVTIGWVKGMRDLHVTDLTAENLMGLRALGVDAGYVRGMAAAGYPELSADKLTGMKAVGVNPEKVKAVREMGFSPNEDELIQMSVFKIDAPFVERMKARGFKNLTIARLVQIKVFNLDE